MRMKLCANGYHEDKRCNQTSRIIDEPRHHEKHDGILGGMFDSYSNGFLIVR